MTEVKDKEKATAKKEDCKAVVISNNDSGIKMMPLEETKQWYNEFVKLSKQILKEKLDYGVIPGVNKPSLFKPGAEKLRFVYGLGVEVACVDKTEDIDRKYLDYTYKAVVRSKTGQILAECEGNCNSYENKWRYRWIKTSKKPEKELAETLKAQGKGKWYKNGNVWTWMERVENPDLIGMKNVLIKMSQKRAFVGAMLIATGASEFFTQDVEDMEEFSDYETVDDEPKKEKEKPKKAEPKKEEPKKEPVAEKVEEKATVKEVEKGKKEKEFVEENQTDIEFKEDKKEEKATVPSEESLFLTACDEVDAYLDAETLKVEAQEIIFKAKEAGVSEAHIEDLKKRINLHYSKIIKGA
jgi:hypothetical protein